MEKFRALLVSKTGTGQHVGITQLTDADLMDGDVTIAVSHSSVNYKDGLGITGKSPIFRKYPLIPGVDLAGVVTQSAHKDYKIGDAVVLGGWGVGEGHHGGYAQVARVNGDWLVPLPSKFSAAEAMAIGVAGYTAMLCVMALEEQGVNQNWSAPQTRAVVIPFWAWYLPSLSRYDVAQTSSAWRKMSWAIPSFG